MTLPGSIGLSPRAQEYYTRFFKPKYEMFQLRVRQTPLVIFIWGPGKSAQDLYQQCQQIRDELVRRGHTASFVEEPATDIRTPIKKGIEFLKPEKGDAIVILQPSFGLIGELHDFIERRVVNSKMLIFVDQAAFDGYSFRGAVAELRALYNNVETFRSPDDLAQNTVLNQVLEKVSVLQIVKFRAIQSAHNWGLIPEQEQSN